MTGELEMLEKRIRRLESPNSHLKWLGICASVLALTAAAWGQTPKNTVVRAQKVELRDDKGRLCAELAVLQAGTKLQINDYRQKVYASVLPEDLAKLHTAKP